MSRLKNIAYKILHKYTYLFPINFYRWFYSKKRPSHDLIKSRFIEEIKQKRIIFIHIPKAAGSSVERRIYSNFNPSIRLGHVFISACEFIFTKQEFAQYFKFTFVRNPWSKVFSAYHYLLQGGINEYDESMKQQIAGFSFEAFILCKLQYDKNILREVHFRPQYRYLLSYTLNKFPIDFFGFFENFEEDFKIVKTKLASDVLIPALNQTKSTEDYRRHYTPEMIEVVAKCYARDIELLAYTFDNSSLAAQLNKRQHKQLRIQQAFSTK